MEDLAGGGGLDDLHVGVRRQLHESLDTRRTVFRPLAFVAVRQHQGDAVDPAPFHFAGSNELVNHHLCAIGEIAELRLPNHQGVRVVRRVSVFKAQHRFFGKNRVDDGERSLVVGRVLQRYVSAGVPFFTVLIVDHRMTVGERAASRIFARQAHRKTAGHQRSKRHVFAHAPVHGQIAPAHGRTVIQYFFHQRMRRHTSRQCGDAFGQPLPLCHGNGRIGSVCPFLADKRSPIDGEFGLEIGQHRFGGIFSCIKSCAKGFDHVITQGLAHSLRTQTFRIQLARTRVSRNLFVHQRLRQTWRVLFVVSQLAKASDVNHHVLAESHAVFKRQLGCQHDDFRIVGIHVQHRCFDHFDDIGAKRRRAHVTRVRGGETDLVVDDDVDSPARGVTPGLGQCQRFLVNALSAESRISMHQHRQYL